MATDTTQRLKEFTGERGQVLTQKLSVNKKGENTMRTLTVKNAWKNLSLIAAGALMATMIAVPLAGSASADEDDQPHHSAPAKITYSIKASNGVPTTFELVERDGTMVLALFVDDAPTFVAPDDEE